ncbi:MAG: hypothetical protein JOZ00_22725 [Mycobacterium sp.]|uniref:hypothetical protein n=1 Tax=Mycobacterium sp. TaxID=1785 RepID=UPI001EB0D829|nr:hypothetical protein [Mycobacterium sp.]MBV8789480.1 hypothetical protein [Mycobacterium sp.]
MPRFTKANEKFLSTGLNWVADTIRAVLVDTDQYTVDLVNHEFLSDIPSAARTATTDALTGKAVTGGSTTSDPIRFPGVSGNESEAIVSFKDTGDPATSSLISYHTAITGFPVTPNTGDININMTKWFTI